MSLPYRFLAKKTILNILSNLFNKVSIQLIASAFSRDLGVLPCNIRLIIKIHPAKLSQHVQTLS